MSRPLSVALSGYYGMRNFGDDLFGLLCAAATRRFWSAEPVLIGPPLLGAHARSTWPRPLPSALYGAGGPAGKLSRLLGFANGLRACDLLVMGGGSVINARESFRKPLMLAAQRRGRAQLAAVGVSIGPFANRAEQATVAEYVRSFAYLAVRDRRSHALALEMGLERIVHDGRDLAGLLAHLVPVAARRGDRSAPVIGVAPCHFHVRPDHPAPAPQAWQDAAIEALAQCASERALAVKVFSLNGHPRHGDAELALRMQSQLHDRGVVATAQLYAGGDPLAMVDAIADCDAFISARLHGAIVAYLCGVPFTIVDYHPKCRDFADDIGLPSALRLTADEHDYAACARALSTMLNETGIEPVVSPNLYAQQALRIFQCAPWSTTAPSTP
ncbi:MULTISPECIES: polysaccharide pyruvyl transferase family protein [unclassified Lysobacter]|uniref:polysaccharide pyruvyl transferase family protein n=1 Tax=unclassified Lysobacter TaxID=2635362 RepID=UPI0006FB99FD|nr:MULTISPECIES: polysaccharide pyruvyl transferase family protein [unclassified Lysobacter]KQZ57032.1 hypothetical protein ASD53_11160 [Lysobacter sp. Root559]KRC34883.1 hypothetical protein ASE10_09350 [Lysobacter sp. Root76]KRD70572.1 hypothetical protein ASE45_01520 [Lysobacter sp. Root96]